LATDEDYLIKAKEHGGEILFIPKVRTLKAKWKCQYGHVFMRSLYHIDELQTFCTVCNQNWGEGICRGILECVFGKEFPKVRLKEMKLATGRALEFDCYNEELKIALEHQGMQHFKAQRFWGGVKALNSQLVRDKIKSDFASKKGIVLLTIPEIGSLTPVEAVPKLIATQLEKQGVGIPKELLEIDVNSIKVKSSRDYYVEKILHEAIKLKFEILEPILGSGTKIKMRCHNGHITLKTPRSLSIGRKCGVCRLAGISKRVQLSDGRQFKSRKAAADALNVNKTTINKAVLNGTKVKGFTIKDLK
jgi:hypothetical protein